MMNDDSTINGRRLVILLITAVVIIAGGRIGGGLITQGAPSVKIGSAVPLVGQATQPLINESIGVKDSRGYSLQDTKYFDNGAWAVAKLISRTSGSERNTVVMQKVGQFYEVVLGPGTSFPSNAITGLPEDVANYLNTNGLGV